MEVRNVCIPVDGSEHSERAYEWYKTNIAQPRDFLIMLHAVEPNHLPTFGAGMFMALPSEDWAKIITECNKVSAAQVWFTLPTHRMLFP